MNCLATNHKANLHCESSKLLLTKRDVEAVLPMILYWPVSDVYRFVRLGKFETLALGQLMLGMKVRVPQTIWQPAWIV